MKVLIYTGNMKTVAKSGVGKAIRQQIGYLKENNIPYTTNAKDDYDIVHLNTVFPDSLIMSVIARLKGKGIVYHGHSTQEDFKRSFIGSDIVAPLFKMWIKLCYSSGDIIITPTEYSKKLIESYGIKKPVVSISNGIDTGYYSREKGSRERFREKYGFSNDDKIIMSVGLFIKRKGILDFIELAKEMPQYKFIWFGYTDTKLLPAEIQKALKTKLPNLYFPGYVSSDELRDAYAGSDLFMFLTYEETEGLVLLEALSMKIPVIIRDIPIYENWFKEGVELYKGRNTEDFKNKAEGILKGKLADTREKAYEEVLKRDLRVCGKQLISQYRRVMAEKKRENGIFKIIYRYFDKLKKKKLHMG